MADQQLPMSDNPEPSEYSALLALNQSTLDAMPTPVVICSVEGKIMRFNQHAEQFWGRRPGVSPGPERFSGSFLLFDLAGNPLAPEDSPMARVLASGVPATDTVIIERPDGTRLHVLTAIEPLRNARGEVEAAIGSLQDISTRVIAEEKLQRSEAFLQGVFKTTPECIKIVCPNGTLLNMNDAGLDMIGADSFASVRGASVFDLIAPEDLEQWKRYHDRICAGESLTWQFRIIALNGTSRIMESSAAPMHGPGGAVFHLAISRDITSHHAAQQALRESEKRSRQLLEAMPAAVYTTDIEGKLTFFNEAAVELWQYHPALEKNWWVDRLTLYRPDGTPLLLEEAPMETAIRNDTKVRNFEVLMERPDGSRVPVTSYPTPLHDEAGRMTGAVNMLIDSSFQKEAETRQQILINELNHRVKNSLSTVQTIVAQTLRQISDIGEARKAVDARLVAFARAHDLLTEESWRSANIQAVVHAALSGHCSDPCRTLAEGPDIRLTPKTALAFSMALHELCTNALKFGALSNDTGRIEVRWKLAGDTQPRLDFIWRERGGPPVHEPERRSFGARLIEKGLAAELGGQARLHFNRDGLSCHIDIPLVVTA